MNDGFALSLSHRYLTQRYIPLALMALAPLRRANNYRFKMVVAPRDQGTPVVDRDTVEIFASVPPGSYVYGINSNFYTDFPTAAVKLTVSGVPVFYDFIGSGSLRATAAQRSLPYHMLAVPTLCGDGLISVEIASLGVGATGGPPATLKNQQVVVYCAIPEEFAVRQSEDVPFTPAGLFQNKAKGI